MKVEDCVRRLRDAAPFDAGHVELDDLGHLIFFVRRDMLHLVADALNDRLAAWTQRVVRPRIPAGFATVSFRRALPAAPFEESTLDMQEGWLHLEPTFAIEATDVSEEDLRAFAQLVPEFLALVEASGRPIGWRNVDEGNAE